MMWHRRKHVNHRQVSAQLNFIFTIWEDLGNDEIRSSNDVLQQLRSSRQLVPTWKPDESEDDDEHDSVHTGTDTDADEVRVYVCVCAQQVFL